MQRLGRLLFSLPENQQTKEDERFIFAIGQIQKIETVQDDRGDFEYFYCNKLTAVYFPENTAPKFWKFYFNANAVDKSKWNTGLIRYVDDSIIKSLLGRYFTITEIFKKIKAKGRVSVLPTLSAGFWK